MTDPFTAARLPNLPRKPFEEQWPEYTETNTLDRYIEEGKADPVRWAELNALWEAGQ